jgi:phosphoglycerate dehydrogenase-like enzyme
VFDSTDALTILLTGSVAGEQIERVRAVAPGAHCRHFGARADLEAQVAEADIIAGDIGAAALGRAARLKWIHSWAAGPDAMLYPEMVASPVVMTCSKGNGAIPLAEHAMWLMLTLNRGALRWLHNQQQRHWERYVHGELNGLTCGIIGLGYSGLDLALKAKAFHMRVIGMRRSNQPAPNVDEIFPHERLHEFLAQSDFVVVTAPRTPETIGMLGEAEFRSMKPTAYFICFSRGRIADDAALLRALREGWIAGAGIDAHGVEPLPPDSPFWTAPNTIVTPHNGATTRGTEQRGFAIFLDNLQRYVNGQPLRNVVDKHAGY